MTAEIAWEPAEWVSGVQYPEGTAQQLRVGDVVSEVFPDPVASEIPKVEGSRGLRLLHHTDPHPRWQAEFGAFAIRFRLPILGGGPVVRHGLLGGRGGSWCWNRYTSVLRRLRQAPESGTGYACGCRQTRSGLPCRHRVASGATHCAAGHPVVT